MEPDRSMRIQIVTPAPTMGLLRDIEVLTPRLDALGAEIVPVFGERPGRADRLARGLLNACGFPPFDLNIFLERPNHRYLAHARRQILIPNQEWVTDRHRGVLAAMDGVWCKSRHAEEIFRGMHLPTRYIGFAGVDRLMPSIGPDWHRFLHVGGSAHRAETRVLLEAWSRHPEWPELTLVRGVHTQPVPLPPNVREINGFLPDTDLRTLQNRCGIHLCHSEVEGFGHLIAEGLSAGAVVLTTDADPMREQVPPGCGVLIEPVGSEPHHLGTRFLLSAESVERGVSTVLAMPSAERAAMAAAGRLAFEARCGAFEAAIAEAVGELIGEPGRSRAGA